MKVILPPKPTTLWEFRTGFALLKTGNYGCYCLSRGRTGSGDDQVETWRDRDSAVFGSMGGDKVVRCRLDKTAVGGEPLHEACSGMYEKYCRCAPNDVI